MSKLSRRVPEEMAPDSAEELPIVARLVVEIRSDGRRTVARGAIEDRVTDESVALKIESTTPLALVRSLTKALLDTPSLARAAVKSLLPGRRGRQS